MSCMCTSASEIKVSDQDGYRRKGESNKAQTRKGVQTLSRTPRPLPLFPSLIGNDLALDLKPIILLHAFDINVPQRGHRS